MPGYVAHEAHKDGGSVCGHDGCTTQALIAESLKCTSKNCKQAAAELESRFKSIDWPAFVPYGLVDREQRQAQIDEAEAHAAETDTPLPGIVKALKAEVEKIDDDRVGLITQAKAEWRARMQASCIDGHGHSHYRCLDHAVDLGKHVGEAADAISEALESASAKP